MEEFTPIGFAVYHFYNFCQSSPYLFFVVILLIYIYRIIWTMNLIYEGRRSLQTKQFASLRHSSSMYLAKRNVSSLTVNQLIDHLLKALLIH